MTEAGRFGTMTVRADGHTPGRPGRKKSESAVDRTGKRKAVFPGIGSMNRSGTFGPDAISDDHWRGGDYYDGHGGNRRARSRGTDPPAGGGAETTMENPVFIDLEVNPAGGTVLDYGAAKSREQSLHTASRAEFCVFLKGAKYIAGHNIVEHDLTYLDRFICVFAPDYRAIDTLYMSPLLFPKKPYHALLKDDKLQTEDLSNPAHDAVKSMELFYDELDAWNRLPDTLRNIYRALLRNDRHFAGFLSFAFAGGEERPVPDAEALETDIRSFFAGAMCENADIRSMITGSPVELAYALAIVSANDRYSITPPWVFRNYPVTEGVLHRLREVPCGAECPYCAEHLNAKKQLKKLFGFDSFRTYGGEPLQENAAVAAIRGKSLLAVFPTGGGKSLTFQLPALIAGEASHGLTVVISPLQSLMKDQVDHLEQGGIAEAVTVNGLLSPVERAEALERVSNGMASILYISPESLRSNTMERVLVKRNVVRFVIDEAHCFSAWGQDFRVDYLYIGDFIRRYMELKNIRVPIPVSCFTATAKQKVVSDIRDYFRQKLGLELDVFATGQARTNLHYTVWHVETKEKYATLRRLIARKDCPTIVYVSRTRTAEKLAEKLAQDGYAARAYHGQMNPSEKIDNQNAFIENRVRIIVATSAFGMGVDKKDVGLVVHYEISDSLENYVQEAGRAGRDQRIEADCYVLFNDDDLNRHFMMLNRTKLSIGEIQQVWKAIKDLTKNRKTVTASALEIARQAGWDESVGDVETRVKTAIAALENAGYVERGKNMPRVYATGIMTPDMASASAVIEKSPRFDGTEKLDAKRVIQSLISARSVHKAGRGEEDGESRVDYLGDILGIGTERVENAVQKLREEGILADSTDMAAYVKRTDTENRSKQILARFSALESYLASGLTGEVQNLPLKELNDAALNEGIAGASVRNMITVLYYWTISSYVRKKTNEDGTRTWIFPLYEKEKLEKKIARRSEIADYIVSYLYEKSDGLEANSRDEVLVPFSLLELKDNFIMRETLTNDRTGCTTDEVRDALLYLSKIGAMSLEGGFLVLYNGLSVSRLVTDNKIRYKQEDYRQLNEFYQNRIRQIHIVGEYANMMLRNYAEALTFVDEYFRMEYKAFIAKYFKGNRAGEINRNITPARYEKLFGSLSETQSEIIRDDSSKIIAVIAGPGSGKTRLLVHKLASLLSLEDIKSEQLLMLTFSRSAAVEFKTRLSGLIGKAAAGFVEIKTFHSYCFDLLGKIGNLSDAPDIVRKAGELITNGGVEPGRITKSVLVIDEAQDMDENEFTLVRALMTRNEDLRVIAVGDDDQNIFAFRGSDSAYLKALVTEYGAKRYELLDNYRSSKAVVGFANAFAKTIPNRLKSGPVRCVSDEEGEVMLIRHPEGSLESAVVGDIRRNYRGERTCVLTCTNEEAFRVMGLLSENGFNARLIQSNDGFDLGDISEMRYFLEQIEKDPETPTVPDAVWNGAVAALRARYAESACLPLILTMIGRFAEAGGKKYRTDFREFVSESRLEDFYGTDGQTLLVSTLHKSKGKEFDTVYVLIPSNVNGSDPETKRALYVGFTRAKERLHVHYAGGFPDRFRASGAVCMTDETAYPEPNRILVHLTHSDVNLGFFKYRRQAVSKLVSGMPLRYENGALFDTRDGSKAEVVRLSRAALDRIGELEKKGYRVAEGEVRFIVRWKGKEEETESDIVLPNLRLERM